MWDSPPSCVELTGGSAHSPVVAPVDVALDRHRQNRRNPARYQETTVSGLTMIRASDLSLANCYSPMIPKDFASSYDSAMRNLVVLSYHFIALARLLPAN
jgi:hypothetical protein